MAGENINRSLACDEDGRLQLRDGNLYMLSGAEALAQDVRTALRLFKGEYFLDLEEGTDWWGEVLIKNPNPDRIRTIIRDRILSRRGILEVVSLTLDYDSAARTLTVTFTATSDFGEIAEEVEL